MKISARLSNLAGFGKAKPLEMKLKLLGMQEMFFISRLECDFSGAPILSKLEVNYNTRFFRNSGKSDSNPDAYTRLILDVLLGRSAQFFREDDCCYGHICKIRGFIKTIRFTNVRFSGAWLLDLMKQ